MCPPVRRYPRSRESRTIRTAYQTLTAIFVAAALALSAPSVASVHAADAAAGGAKVVIVVGPTGSATADYLEDAATAAAAARKWTANVVELYTPDATWANVSDALQGASIVVYMGHGNGFPNPRAKSLDGATMNGLGLNPPGGAKLTPTRYYGEDVIAGSVRLAPSAVVILNHLCYAAGSSEPGDPDPSLAVARQRADNFAAGWLRAGAGAVIADAWFGSAAAVIDSLFSTATPVDDLWRALPSANGAEIASASARTPGATVHLDPDGTKYWRSVTSMPGLSATDVVGGRAADTALAPASLQVPGAAEVGAAGAPLYASATAASEAPTTVLAPGTRVRVVRDAGTPKAGPLAGRPAVEVRALDGSAKGLVPADALMPRDSRAPVAYLLDGAVPAISPNGDGIADVLTLSGRLSEPATWNASITAPGGATLVATGGEGDAFVLAWDGTVNGAPVADGRYDVSVTALDAWGNSGSAVSLALRVDRTVPVLTATFPATPTVVSPDGDGAADTLRTAYAASEPGTLAISVRDAAGVVVDTSEVPASSGASVVIWDGKGPTGAPIPDGSYTYEIVPRDAAGNVGQAVVRRIVVSTAIGWVRSTATVIDPATPSALVRDVALSFTLARQATVTWSMADAKGRSVRFFAKAQRMTPGPQSATWDGRDDAGALLPPGAYTMVLRANDGVTQAVARTTVGIGPFRVVTSPAILVHGKVATFTIMTALQVTGTPEVLITLPGAGTLAVPVTRVDGSTWRGKMKLSAGTRAGTATVVVTGTDATGAPASATFRVAVK
jgi:flagellar hook assembly protein FlgD